MKTTLCRLPKVMASTGMSRSTIYQRMKEGTFPKSVKIGPRMVAWRQSEIDDWIDSCMSSSEETQSNKNEER